MPAILLKALEWLAETALVKIGGSLMSYFKEWMAARAKQKATEDAAQKSVDPLKKATTGKEIDDATDDTLNGV